MADTQTTSGGIGVYGLLGVAFVILKLCKVIDWSWWWVTCPFWGPIALFFLFMIGLAGFIGIVALIAFVMD